jgi:hypothetical protein
VKRRNGTSTEFRLWYNEWLEKQNKDLKVLDIGKSAYWDYSHLFRDYKTIDINPDLKPDIIGNAEDYPLEKYDLVLLNGMYEFTDVKKILNNIKADRVICGFVTEHYRSYRTPWKYFDGNMEIFKDWKIDEVCDFVKYIYIIISK